MILVPCEVSAVHYDRNLAQLVAHAPGLGGRPGFDALTPEQVIAVYEEVNKERERRARR